MAGLIWSSTRRSSQLQGSTSASAADNLSLHVPGLDGQAGGDDEPDVGDQPVGEDPFDGGSADDGGELDEAAEAQLEASLQRLDRAVERDEAGMDDDDDDGDGADDGLDGDWEGGEEGGSEAGGMEEAAGEDDVGDDDAEPQAAALTIGLLEEGDEAAVAATAAEEEEAAAAGEAGGSWVGRLDAAAAGGDAETAGDVPLQDILPDEEEGGGEEGGGEEEGADEVAAEEEGEAAGATGSRVEDAGEGAAAAGAAGGQRQEVLARAAAGRVGSLDLNRAAAARLAPASGAATEPARASAYAAAATVAAAEAASPAGVPPATAAAAPSADVQTPEEGEEGQQQQSAAGSTAATAAAQGVADGAAAGVALAAQATAGWKPRCAVVNNRSWHLDVAAGLAWAFQAAGCEVTVYLPTGTFGLDDVMSGWFKGDRRHVLKLQNESYRYDAIIVTTFPETHTQLLESLLHDDLPGRSAARRKSQRFLAVVHNPDRLLSRKAVKALVAQHAVERGDGAPPRLQLLALAPSTAAYSRHLVQRWLRGIAAPHTQLSLRWLSPLSPWRPSFSPVEVRRAEASTFKGDGSLRHLCIQGILDPKRRDYAGAFKALSHPAVAAQLRARNESLLLLGHAAHEPLRVPAGVWQHVQQLTGLPYKEYYDTLSRCRAILPAFGSDEYLYRKSSSTVATAINVGSPLLAEDRLRDAYSFVPAEAVFGFAPPDGASAVDVAALAAEAAVPFIRADAAAAAGTVLADGGEGAEEAWEDEEAEEAAYKAAQRQAEAAVTAAAAAAAAPLASATSRTAETRQPAPPRWSRVADVADAEDAEDGGAAEAADWEREAAADAEVAGMAETAGAAAQEEEPGAAGDDELLSEELEEEAAAAGAAAAAAKAAVAARAAEAAAAAKTEAAEASEAGFSKRGPSHITEVVAAVEEEAEGEAAAADWEAEAAEESAAATGVDQDAEEGEEEGEEGDATDAALAEVVAVASKRSKKRGRLLAAKARVAGQQAAGEAPQQGSYAAAMLRAFQPGAAEAAHAAARQLKSDVMTNNRQVAADFLAGAAALVAAQAVEQAGSTQGAAVVRTATAAAAATATEKAAGAAAAGKPDLHTAKAHRKGTPEGTKRALQAGSALVRRDASLLPRHQD
ncbi:hypothetical protein C2E20_0744 [Micractinium conductrix]|uniref:Uncharacterized protein n=1 Tax=Micractinium conductrix TaxID=554055 RepID=A0A2P6VPW6_9CHLO|nr:hypothetical protein C2E20_0744 [Micractinium conductrix]|eukprot:PSC76144.1 hypothetical protein C2E20_0744 [Micractinium conductrix]